MSNHLELGYNCCQQPSRLLKRKSYLHLGFQQQTFYSKRIKNSKVSMNIANPIIFCSSVNTTSLESSQMTTPA